MASSQEIPKDLLETLSWVTWKYRVKKTLNQPLPKGYSWKQKPSVRALEQAARKLRSTYVTSKRTRIPLLIQRAQVELLLNGIIGMPSMETKIPLPHKYQIRAGRYARWIHQVLQIPALQHLPSCRTNLEKMEAGFRLLAQGRIPMLGRPLKMGSVDATTFRTYLTQKLYLYLAARLQSDPSCAKQYSRDEEQFRLACAHKYLATLIATLVNNGMTLKHIRAIISKLEKT